MAPKPATAEIKEAANEALHDHDARLGVQNAADIQRTIITRSPPILYPLPLQTRVESVSQNTRSRTNRHRQLPGSLGRLQDLVRQRRGHVNDWLELHNPSAFCAYADRVITGSVGYAINGAYLHLRTIEDSRTVRVPQSLGNPLAVDPKQTPRTAVDFLVVRREDRSGAGMGAYLGHFVVNKPDVNIRINGHELRKETAKVKRRIAGPLPKFCVIEVGDGGPVLFFWFLKNPDEEKSAAAQDEEENGVDADKHGNKKSKTKLPPTVGATGTDANVPPNPPTGDSQKSAEEPENAPVDAPHTEAPNEPENPPEDGSANGSENQPEVGPGNGPTNGHGNGHSNGPGNPPGNAPATEEDKEQPEAQTACEEFVQRLRQWQEMSERQSPKTTAHKFGKKTNRELEDEEVNLAILSVTESVAEDFARISTGAVVAIRGDLRDVGPFSGVLRPRSRLLLPWVDCNHTFLVVVTPNPELTPAGMPTARIEIYDSAPGYHRGGCRESKSLGAPLHMRQIHGQIRDLIRAAGWLGNPQGNGSTALPNPIVIQQLASIQGAQSDACGMHTVFNAWCIAMNLRINPDMTQARRKEFYENGLLIMNLAVQGRMDSRTIIKFFECYGFIQPAGAGAQINYDQVARTTRMEDDNAMTAHFRFFGNPGQPPAIDEVRIELIMRDIPFNYGSDTLDQLRIRLEQNLNGRRDAQQQQEQTQQQPPQTPTSAPQVYTSANRYPQDYEDWSVKDRVEWIQKRMDERGWKYSPGGNLINLQTMWEFLLEANKSKNIQQDETVNSQEPDPGASTVAETNTQPGASGLGISVHESSEPVVNPDGPTGSANDNSAQDTSNFNWNGEDSTGDDLPSDESPSMDLPSDNSASDNSASDNSASDNSASGNSASMDLSSDDSTSNAPGKSGEAQATGGGGGAKKRGASDEGNGDGNGGGSAKKQKKSNSGKQG